MFDVKLWVVRAVKAEANRKQATIMEKTFETNSFDIIALTAKFDEK